MKRQTQWQNDWTKKPFNRVTAAILLIIFSLLPAVAPQTVQALDDHLLLCEVVLDPTDGEFIEIANPGSSAVNLDDYYLSDDEEYALLPGASGAGPAPSIHSSDFIVQFPAGTSIPAGGVIVVAVDGAGFESEYGSKADFEIKGTDTGTTDMIATDAGGGVTLTNGGELAVLFFWDGASDLVKDVDMANIGQPTNPNDIGDKSSVSVDGPDAGTAASTYQNDAVTMPEQDDEPGDGESTKRIALEGSNETTGSGNGITGDDETSEDIAVTWDNDSTFTAPNPGTCQAVETTAITLVSFTAASSPAGVSLAWETGTEIDNAGFNLYRATAEAGPYHKINPALIPAKGSAVGGASYSYLDTGATAENSTYYYKLEDIDFNGVSTFHGPVDTAPGLSGNPEATTIYLPLIVKYGFE